MTYATLDISLSWEVRDQRTEGSWKKAGSWGLTGCWSFYPFKILGGYLVDQYHGAGEYRKSESDPAGCGGDGGEVCAGV